MDLKEPALTELGRLGSLVVKIADSPQEIEAAQRLRHKVFKAEESDQNSNFQRDEDHFDQYCDHLIVVEEATEKSEIVATYRLMGEEQAIRAGRFYSQSEFDVESLIKQHPELRFLELGRSCVLPVYRTKRTIELLWHGSWAYVRKHRYDVMFGCASFSGIDPEPHQEALSFLAEQAKPEEGWDVSGIGNVIALANSARELEHAPDLKQALRGLPPLIKGYLRLGAMFAQDAVIDHDFETIDVLVLLPLFRLNPRYVNYYGENAERYSV